MLTHVFEDHKVVNEEDKLALEQIPNSFTTFHLGSSQFATAQLKKTSLVVTVLLMKIFCWVLQIASIDYGIFA